jgi:hypothetical protein
MEDREGESMKTRGVQKREEKFIAEMAKRGWQLDPNGWIIPEGRRIHQRESDWLASILLSIECECPAMQEQKAEPKP